MNRDLVEIEARCVEQMEMDYTPFHDIVREFSGFDRQEPSTAEFLHALEFLEYILNKYKITCYEGPGTKELNWTTAEMVKYLSQKWHADKYNDINYGIWFEKK